MWSTSAGGQLMKVVNLTGFTVYIYIYIYVKSNILVQPITSYEYLNLDDHFSVGVFKLVHFKLVIIYL